MSKQEDEVKDPAQVKDDKELSLNEALEKNAERLAKEHGLVPEVTKEQELAKKPEKEEEKKEEKEEEETPEVEDEELSEEAAAQAKLIYKLLNNPKTALSALDTLARTAGFSLREIEDANKKETKEIVKSIKEVVQEKLGTKIPFLSAELGDVLETVIKDAVKEQTRELKETVEKEALARRQTELQNTFEKVVESYDGVTEAVLKEVTKVQERKEIVPGEMSPDKYFRVCLKLAAENLGVDLKKKSAEGSPKPKTSEPAKKVDVIQQLAAKKNLTHKEGLKSHQITTMKDAIEAAAEKIDAEFAGKL